MPAHLDIANADKFTAGLSAAIPPLAYRQAQGPHQQPYLVPAGVPQEKRASKKEDSAFGLVRNTALVLHLAMRHGRYVNVMRNLLLEGVEPLNCFRQEDF